MNFLMPPSLLLRHAERHCKNCPHNWSFHLHTAPNRPTIPGASNQPTAEYLIPLPIRHAERSEASLPSKNNQPTIGYLNSLQTHLSEGAQRSKNLALKKHDHLTSRHLISSPQPSLSSSKCHPQNHCQPLSFPLYYNHRDITVYTKRR